MKNFRKNTLLLIGLILLICLSTMLYTYYYECKIPLTNIPLFFMPHVSSNDEGTGYVIYSNKVCYYLFPFGGEPTLKLVAGADPKTFQRIDNSTLAKDKNHVWWGDSFEIIGADPKTITPIYYTDPGDPHIYTDILLSKDKDNLYMGNQKFVDYYQQQRGQKINFDVNTFVYLGGDNRVFKDKDHTFSSIGPTMSDNVTSSVIITK